MLRLLVALFYLFAVAASADEYLPPSSVGSITGLGSGVAALLAGTATGTGGPVGSVNPTITGTSVLLNGLNPANIPVVHPSSYNFQGSSGAEFLVANQNMQITADVMYFVSSDPSADLTGSFSGAPAASGDTTTLTFTTAAATPCAAGCTASFTPTSTSLSAMVAGLIAAIKANPTLFVSPNGGGAGVIQGAAPIPSCAATGICLDWNTTYGSMTIALSHTGGGNQALSWSSRGCTVTCSLAWDINPGWLVGRVVPGVAPASGSQLWTLDSESGTSTNPSVGAAVYGIIQNRALNSTTGSLEGQWEFCTPNTAGVVNNCLEVDSGTHDANVPSPGTGNFGAEAFNAGISGSLNGIFQGFGATSGKFVIEATAVGGAQLYTGATSTLAWTTDANQQTIESGPLTVASTVLGTVAAGNLLLGGIVAAGFPTLGNNGEGAILESTQYGLMFQGLGSTSDILFADSAGTAFLYNVHGSTAIVMANVAGTGSRPLCATASGQIEAGSLSAGLTTCP